MYLNFVKEVKLIVEHVIVNVFTAVVKKGWGFQEKLTQRMNLQSLKIYGWDCHNTVAQQNGVRKMRFNLQRNKMLCLKLTIESFCLAGYPPGRLWVSEPQSWLLHISSCQTTALVLAGCWDTQSFDTTIESNHLFAFFLFWQVNFYLTIFKACCRSLTCPLVWQSLACSFYKVEQKLLL